RLSLARGGQADFWTGRAQVMASPRHDPEAASMRRSVRSADDIKIDDGLIRQSRRRTDEQRFRQPMMRPGLDLELRRGAEIIIPPVDRFAGRESFQDIRRAPPD